MSRARHEKMKKAEGGKIEPEMKARPYDAEGSEVEKEAEEKKRGGRMKKKHGGEVKAKHDMEAMGHEKKHRLDRPGRKMGGRIGSDKAPLTSAAKYKSASEHDPEDSGNADEGP